MKVKKLTMEILMVAMIMIACIIIFPNAVNAAVSYTKKVPSNDGSIEINLTGLTLSDEKTYSFALVEKAKKPESWVEISDYTTSTAKVVLNPSTQAIKDVLKKTNTGYLYVKDNSAEDGTYVVEKLQVDLKLPLLQAISYRYAGGYYTINQLYDAIGDKHIYTESNTYYQCVKVTDKNLIEKYLKIKNSKGDVTTLESSLPSAPTTGYDKGSYISGSNKNDGLYLLWLKLTGDGTKEVYGCIIHDGLPDATKVEDYVEVGPKVKEIRVISPDAGTYKAPQTVKVLVRFDKKITGSKVPTLKIKFGESQERSLTNGTIQNDYYLTSEGVIIYSYNIQAGDEGQLVTVSLAGGNITDEKGNEAVLSCPVITGNAIKANTEGQVTNNTDNQDKTNNNQSQNGNGSGTGTNSGNNSGTTTNKPSGTTTNNNNSNSKDDTTVKGKLPQTGVNETIIAIISAVAVIGGVLYVRYRKMKDII